MQVMMEKSVKLFTDDHGGVAFEPGRKGQVHVLNPSATMALLMCDGSKTPGEISYLLSGAVDKTNNGAKDCNSNILEWIAQAKNLGLICDGTPVNL